jgi:hypothetical protein
MSNTPGCGCSAAGAAPAGDANHGHGHGSHSHPAPGDPKPDAPPPIAAPQPAPAPGPVVGPALVAFSYSVKFLCGRQEACPCGCTPVVPGIYATEINIHNPNDVAALILKLFIPLVLGSAVIGREPKVAGPKAADFITLPPHNATMDDCCRISELLLGAPAPATASLSIGILEILSVRELSVSAVYTVSNPTSGSVDIDVNQIPARLMRISAEAARETPHLRPLFAPQPG